jgi:hypothetical protein
MMEIGVQRLILGTVDHGAKAADLYSPTCNFLGIDMQDYHIGSQG